MAPTDRQDVVVAQLSPESFKADWNPDRERLNLAKWVLGVIAALGVAAVVVYVNVSSDAGKDVFETAKVVLPPIATLD